ncbi:MAG: hypothetical protein R3A44_05185 [Caldilineaceae bacterium]
MKLTLSKIMIAVALTLALFSSGIIGEEIGVPMAPSVSACGGGLSHGSGGGC